MALFGLFGKKSKPNLANPQPYRTYSDAPNYQSLSELAKQRIKAGTTGERTPGVGFGEDFVSKTTNPVIAQRNARFTEQEMPFLSSQLSARGVGRSGGAGLATDVVNKASLQKSRDIDEIFAKMYELNAMQEKRDISEGIALGKNLDDSYIGQENVKSAAGEREVNATAAQQINRQKMDDAGYLQGAALLAAPFTGGISSGMAFSQPSQSLYDVDMTQLQSLQGSDIYNKWLNGQFNALGAK